MPRETRAGETGVDCTGGHFGGVEAEAVTLPVANPSANRSCPVGCSSPDDSDDPMRTEGGEAGGSSCSVKGAEIMPLSSPGEVVVLGPCSAAQPMTTIDTQASSSADAEKGACPQRQGIST